MATLWGGLAWDDIPIIEERPPRPQRPPDRFVVHEVLPDPAQLSRDATAREWVVIDRRKGRAVETCESEERARHLCVERNIEVT